MSSRYMILPNWPNTDRDTPGILFKKILHHIQINGHYDKIAPIIDYALADESNRELTNYEFEFQAIVTPGGNEGIYLDCSLRGAFDDSEDKYCKVGTIKTLEEGVNGFKLMGELAGLMSCYCHSYVNGNLYRYMPASEQKRHDEYIDLPDEMIASFQALFTSHPIQTTKQWVKVAERAKGMEMAVESFDALTDAFEDLREKHGQHVADTIYHNVWTVPIKRRDFDRAAEAILTGKLDQFNQIKRVWNCTEEEAA